MNKTIFWAADLVCAGYTKYPVPRTKMSDMFYQKWIRRESGEKLFALDFWLYDYPNKTITVSAQLYLPGDASFKVELAIPYGMSISLIEEWFMNVWNKLNCVPDPYN